jgi:acetyltransferase-like isoleucine patch superfamily enzyme
MSGEKWLAHDWHPAPLPSNVHVGEQSWLYSAFAFLNYRSTRPCGVRIGRASGVYRGTMFDLGTNGEVEIGDYCTVAGPTINTNGRVVIGDYALISYHVVIADTFAAIPPRDEGPPLERPALGDPAVSIVIGDDVWIGARAVILAGARVRDGAIVGAASVVDFEVPPRAIAAGNPARIVGWV